MKTAVGYSCPACQAQIPATAPLCPRCGEHLKTKKGVASNHVGAVLGNLRLVELLGEGGMGQVYRAEHTSLSTSYAVKILHAEFLDDRDAAERFRREAIVCSQLRHPNIVFVTDFGIHEEFGLYIAMEYLRGQTMKSYLQARGRMTPWELLHIGGQLCEGLEVAHEQGIIHRDLKPENVFLTPRPEGRVLAKLLDFGIVRMADSKNKNLTQAGTTLGTPTYMSPEQIKVAKDLTTASDIYALGVVFYEALAGRPPFEGENFMELALRHVTELPEPVSKHLPALADTQLERLLSHMLSKEPNDRPASVRVVHERLKAALQELKEKGHEGAWAPDHEDSRFEGGGGEARKTPVHLSGIVRQIKQDSPKSRVAQALQQLPNLPALPPDLFYLMIWGLLVRDIVDLPPSDPGYAESAGRLARFTENLLQSAENDEDPKKLLSILEASLRDLFALCDQAKQEGLVKEMRASLSHPLFPNGALPSWAKPAISGSWSLGAVLRSDVRDLVRMAPKLSGTHAVPPSGAAAAAPKELPSAPPAAAPPPAPPVATDEEKDAGLLGKLSQDVSIKSLKSVLGHDLFGKKK